MKHALEFLVAAGLAIDPSAASAREWYFLVERPGYIYFADAASLERSGEILEVEFLQGNLDSWEPGEHAMLRYRIDCGAGTLQLHSGRYFEDSGSQIPDLNLPASPVFVPADTVSPGQSFHDFACKDAHRNDRVDDPFAAIRAARANGS